MTLAAARNRRQPAQSTLVTAPTIRATQYLDDYGPGLTGDKAHTLATAPLVGSSILVVAAAQYGQLEGITVGGTLLDPHWSRAGVANFEEAFIAWGDVTTSTTAVTAHYNASFSANECLMQVYELTGLAGKTILSTTLATVHQHIAAGGTASVDITATAPGQLVVGVFSSHDDQNIDPTWTENPGGAWTHLRKQSILTASFGLSGAAGLHTITRDNVSGPGMDTVPAAALIG